MNPPRAPAPLAPLRRSRALTFSRGHPWLPVKRSGINVQVDVWGGGREGSGGVREVGGGEGEGGGVAWCRRVTDTVFDRVQARLTLQHPGRISPIATVFCSVGGGGRVPYTPPPPPLVPPTLLRPLPSLLLYISSSELFMAASSSCGPG